MGSPFHSKHPFCWLSHRTCPLHSTDHKTQLLATTVHSFAFAFDSWAIKWPSTDPTLPLHSSHMQTHIQRGSSELIDQKASSTLYNRKAARPKIRQILSLSFSVISLFSFEWFEMQLLCMTWKVIEDDALSLSLFFAAERRYFVVTQL